MTLRRRKGKTFPDLSGERKEWEHHLQRKKVCTIGSIDDELPNTTKRPVKKRIPQKRLLFHVYSYPLIKNSQKGE